MKEEITDSYGVVYVIFVLLGTGTLLPWNVFLTEKEFYDVRFKVEPYLPYVSQNFMSLFALAFNTLNLGALAVLIKVQRYLSLRVLVLQPLLITLVMLGCTAALALRTDISGTLMAQFTLPSIALMGVCTALLQGGTLQLASLFSPRHIRAVVSGIAVGGLVTSSLSFTAQLRARDSAGAGPSAADVAPAAFIYFTASSVVIGACVLGYLALPMLPYGRYKLLLAGLIDDPVQKKLMSIQEEYEEPLLMVVEGDGPSTSTGMGTEVTRAAIICVEADRSQATRSWQHKHAFSLYCAALFVCLCVTMGCHPGLTSFICSTYNPASVSPCLARPPGLTRMQGDLFVPFMYVLFAMGDFLGRAMSGWGPWGRRPPRPMSILTYSVLRAALACGVLFCHVITPAPWALPQYFTTDVAPLAIILGLGWTQGHLISTICSHAPSTLLPAHASRYGPVTSFAISAGSWVGSLVSLTLATRFQVSPI